MQLVRREVREYLSPGGLDLLFAGAECVVEGGDELGARAGSRRVYATVMVTIPLSRAASWFREAPDDATAVRVAELMEASPAVAPRLVALARPRMAEIAGVPADGLEISLELQVRADGACILIDGDAMAVVGR